MSVYWLSIAPILVIILVVHEMGHLIAARMFGVKVLEFGIGFPPRLVAFATGNTAVAIDDRTVWLVDGSTTASRPTAMRKGALARVQSVETEDGRLIARKVQIRSKDHRFNPADETTENDEPAGPPVVHRGRIRAVSEDGFRIADLEWSLNLIPVGAFVNLHEDTSQRSKMALNVKPNWQRVIVILAGILANLAFPVLPIAAATLLHSADPKMQVVEVMPDSPAHRAGIQAGDLIVGIQGDDNPTVAELNRWVTELDQLKIQLIDPAGNRRAIVVDPAPVGPMGEPMIGVTVTVVGSGTINPRGAVTVPDRTARNTVALYREFYLEISSWSTGDRKPQVAGIVGIVQETKQVVETSHAVGFLVVMAVLSVNVGLVNLLPIAPMDGGRLAMIAYEAARKNRPISKQSEMRVAGMGLVLIAVITVWLAIVDLSRLIAP